MHNTRPSVVFAHPSGSAPPAGGFGVGMAGGGAGEAGLGGTVVGGEVASGVEACEGGLTVDVVVVDVCVAVCVLP